MADEQSLILTVNLADGSQPLRFGPEELDFDGILLRSSFETAMPGGHGPGDFAISRRDDYDPLSAGRGLWAGVKLTDMAGRNVYEGRITGTPKTGVMHLEIQTEGWSKVSEDNGTAKEMFINSDLNAWGSVSNKCRVAFLNVPWFEPSIEPDPNDLLPSLKLGLQGLWAINARCRAMFDCGSGMTWAKMYYAFAGNLGSANFFLSAISSADSNAATYQTGNLNAASGSGYVTPTSQNRYAFWEVFDGVAEGGNGNDYGWFLRKLRVYGNQGLTGRGEDPQGYYISDMIQYIVQKYLPQLTVRPDTVEMTTFPVPHASYQDDMTPRDMIEALVLFGGNTFLPMDWFVYDDRTFWLQSPGSYGTVWSVRGDEGSTADFSGPDAGSRPNAVKARWDDGSGTMMSVGLAPMNADFVDPSLAITDPTHPANVAGLTVWPTIDMGVNTQAGATLLGQMYLFDKNREEWRGSQVVQGEDGIVRDNKQNEQPVYMIRSGDRLVQGDAADTRERNINHTNYDSAERATSCDIGPKPNRFDALLAQAGVSVSPSFTSRANDPVKATAAPAEPGSPGAAALPLWSWPKGGKAFQPGFKVGVNKKKKGAKK